MQKQHTQNRGDERLHRVKHGAKARVHHPQAVIPERMGHGGAEKMPMYSTARTLCAEKEQAALCSSIKDHAPVRGQGAANRNQRDLHRVVAAADAADDDRGGGPEEDADQHHQYAGGIRCAAQPTMTTTPSMESATQAILDRVMRSCKRARRESG